MNSEEQVREAFEPIIKAQAERLQELKARYAEQHKMQACQVRFQIRAEGRIYIQHTFVSEPTTPLCHESAPTTPTSPS